MTRPADALLASLRSLMPHLHSLSLAVGGSLSDSLFSDSAHSAGLLDSQQAKQAMLPIERFLHTVYERQEGASSPEASLPATSSPQHDFLHAFPAKDKATFYYLDALFGLKALHQVHSSSAPVSSIAFREPRLLKACKLNPNAIEAWNALGHCLWEKKDYGGAKKSYERAISIGERLLKQNHDNATHVHFYKKQTVIAYRELSIVLRLISNTLTDPDQVKQLVNTSFDYAKKAVFFNLADGRSWTIMGNALLCKFLRSNNMAHVDSALQAYTRALATEDANLNPDLHFNRANVCKFKQNYQQAFAGFTKAFQLDPTFHEAQHELQHLTKMMHLIEDIIDKKAGIKKKRLKKLVSQIPSVIDSVVGRSITAATEGSVKLGDNLPLFDAQTGKRLTNWNEGIQKGRSITFRVIQLVNEQKDIPLVFVATDANSNFFLFSIYNVHASAVMDSDYITIHEPEVRLLTLSHDILDRDFEYVNVIAREPEKVLINRREISEEKILPPDFTMDTK